MLYEKGQGRYEKQYQQLWDALVPVSAQATTIQGELVRVIGRLASEFYRNGNANWDMGFRLYTNFLAKHLPDKAVFDEQVLNQIKTDIQEIRCHGSGNGKPSSNYAAEDDAFDRITDRIVEWCRYYAEPIHRDINPKLKR